MTGKVATMACVVQDCSTNIEELTPKGITLHAFPRRRILLEIWLRVLNKETTAFDWSKDKWICSRHFQEDDFTSNKNNLTADAVPSLFLNVENMSVTKMEEKVQESHPKKIIPQIEDISSDSENVEKKNTNNGTRVKKCAAAFCEKPDVKMCGESIPVSDAKNECTTVPDSKKEFTTIPNVDPEQSLKKKNEFITRTTYKMDKLYKPNQLCRLCFKIGSVSLFSGRYYSKLLKDIAKLFIPIDFKATDVSTVVCMDCKNELGRFYDFMIKIFEVDEYFQVINKEANNKKNTIEDIRILDPLSLMNDECDEKVEEENIMKNINTFHNYAKPAHKPENKPEDEPEDKLEDKSSNSEKKTALKSAKKRKNKSEDRPSKSKKKAARKSEKERKVRPVKCIYCNQIIDNIKNLAEHCKAENHDPIFTCHRCHEMFKNREDLNEHTSSHLRNYMCDKCGKSFRCLDSLTFHLNRVHHIGDLKFACKECPKKFVNRYTLRLHIQRHTNEKPYCCEQCGSVFYSSQLLKNHQIIHSDYKPFKCSICNREFQFKSKLKTHILTHTGESKKFTCDKCWATYKYKDNLKRHMRNVHLISSDTNNQPHKLKSRNQRAKKNYSCLKCNITFDGYHPYHKHNLKHNPHKKKFVCTYCSKRFMNAMLLKVHTVVHTGERNFECEICNKKFTQKPHLQTHMFTHTGEKRYKCHFCSKAFAQPANLIMHERTHTGEKPYVCTYCGRTFANSANRVRHLSTQHGVLLNRVKSMDQKLKAPLPKVIIQENINIAVEQQENIEKEQVQVQYIFMQENIELKLLDYEVNVVNEETEPHGNIEWKLLDYRENVDKETEQHGNIQLELLNYQENMEDKETEPYGNIELFDYQENVEDKQTEQRGNIQLELFNYEENMEDEETERNGNIKWKLFDYEEYMEDEETERNGNFDLLKLFDYEDNEENVEDKETEQHVNIQPGPFNYEENMDDKEAEEPHGNIELKLFDYEDNVEDEETEQHGNIEGKLFDYAQNVEDKETDQDGDIELELFNYEQNVEDDETEPHGNIEVNLFHFEETMEEAQQRRNIELNLFDYEDF